MKELFGKDFGSKLINRFFRRVDNVLWDLMTGNVGVRTDEGIVTLSMPEGEDPTVQINPFDQFGVALPAFAQNTPVAQIKVGDLIYGQKKLLGWVVKVPAEGKKQFSLVRPDGTGGNWSPPNVQSIGLDLGGAMVLRSLINTLPGGDLSGMQSMLLPMMAMGGGDAFEDMEDMLPLMLMSQCGLGGMGTGGTGAAGGMGGMGGMLQTMMMMKMMGGGFGRRGGEDTAVSRPKRRESASSRIVGEGDVRSWFDE
jgi:hypothetical protein